jgi:hypothetical protein
MVTLLYFFPFCLSVTSLYPKLGKNEMASLAPTITRACHGKDTQISVHLHTERGTTLYPYCKYFLTNALAGSNEKPQFPAADKQQGVCWCQNITPQSAIVQHVCV